MLSLKTNAIHVIALTVCMLLGGVAIDNAGRIDWAGTVLFPFSIFFSLVLGLAGGVVTGFGLGALRFRMNVTTAKNFTLHYLVLVIALILGLLIDRAFLPKVSIDLPPGFGITAIVYLLTSWIGVLISLFAKFLY